MGLAVFPPRRSATCSSINMTRSFRVLGLLAAGVPAFFWTPPFAFTRLRGMVDFGALPCLIVGRVAFPPGALGPVPATAFRPACTQ